MDSAEDKSLTPVAAALRALIERTAPKADAVLASLRLTQSQGRDARAFELASEDIAAQTGLGKAACAAIDMIDELCRYAAIEAFGTAPKLETLATAGEYFRALCRGRHVEYCYLACLDEDRRLTGVKLMGKGTLDAADVYVRNIAQEALRRGAKYALLAHNHPGGGLTPSAADIELTRRTKMALGLMDIRLIEHVIVTQTAYMGIIDGGYV